MLPKLVIEEFIRVKDAIKDPITKFGGQPVWITEAQWPISAGWDERPMMFVAQIALDKRIFGNTEHKMAYIFISHSQRPDEDFFDPDIIDPDGGENAIIIQPGGQVYVKTKKITDGPSLFDSAGLPYEANVRLKFSNDPDFIDSELFRKLSKDQQKQYTTSVDGNKIGGTPYFFQGDEWPTDDDEWLLLLQLNSGFLPFYLNLGASPTAFGFISKDLCTGKLLIQDM